MTGKSTGKGITTSIPEFYCKFALSKKQLKHVEPENKKRRPE